MPFAYELHALNQPENPFEHDDHGKEDSNKANE